MKKILSLALIVAALGSTTACTAVTNGEWKYVNLLNRKSITSIELGADKSLKVRGYSSDASEAIKAAAEGLAKGLTEGAIPK